MSSNPDIEQLTTDVIEKVFTAYLGELVPEAQENFMKWCEVHEHDEHFYQLLLKTHPRIGHHLAEVLEALPSTAVQ